MKCPLRLTHRVWEEVAIQLMEGALPTREPDMLEATEVKMHVWHSPSEYELTSRDRGRSLPRQLKSKRISQRHNYCPTFESTCQPWLVGADREPPITTYILLLWYICGDAARSSTIFFVMIRSLTCPVGANSTKPYSSGSRCVTESRATDSRLSLLTSHSHRCLLCLK